MTTPADLRAVFAAAAARADAQVRWVPAWPEAAREISLLAASRPLVLSRSAARAWRRSGAPVPGGATVATGMDPALGAEGWVGVALGVAAVAETGSVLVSEHDLADRAVSTLAPALAVVVEGTPLASLDDIAGLLPDGRSGASFAALITGPSRTADIERSLTIGVQGPFETTVIVIDGAGDPGP